MCARDVLDCGAVCALLLLLLLLLRALWAPPRACASRGCARRSCTMAVAALAGRRPVGAPPLASRLAVYICSRVVELLRRVDRIRERHVSLSELRALDLGALSGVAIRLAECGDDVSVQV